MNTQENIQRARICFLLVCALCALSCSHHNAQEPAKVSQRAAEPDAPSCPSPSLELEPSRCEALPASYGKTPEQPLEWGPAASQRQLWFGRLACPNKEMPVVELEGMWGKAPTPSKAPPSSITYEALDLLDVWAVRCPGQSTQRLYLNLYRCGNPCPPKGFGLLEAKPFGLYTQSVVAYQTHGVEKAYSLAKEAYALEPASELFALWLAGLANELGEHEHARQLYELRLKASPGSPQLVVRLAETLLLLDQPKQAHRVLSALIKEIGAAHPLYPYALCLSSTALMVLDPPSAVAQGKLACSAGEASCCE